MDPVLKSWIELWDYLDGNFWQVWQWADHLDPEQVSWQPVPNVASIGWNLQHLAEMLDHYLTYVCGQPGPVSPVRSTMRSYHKKVRPAYRRFLLSLHGSDLDRVIERQGKPAITFSWAIGHIAEHESYHLGRCTLLRNLLASR
jgi:DinB superfamily